MRKLFEKLGLILIYLASSTLTIALNKYIMKNLNFKSHYMLIVIQSIIITLIISGQLISTNLKINYSNLSKWTVASLLLTGMMITNMKAIYYIPLSIFTLYKNCSIIFVAFLELKLFKYKIRLIGYISFLLMIVSSVLGNKSEHFDHRGYAWIIANILSSSFYVIYLKKMMVIDHSSRTESVFLTNLLSIPLLLGLSILFDKFEPIVINIKLIMALIISSVFAYLTSFSTAWAVRRLSSTSFTMIGAVNKFFLSLSGFVIFKEVADIRKVLSLIVGILSGVVYSLDTLKNKSRMI